MPWWCRANSAMAAGRKLSAREGEPAMWRVPSRWFRIWSATWMTRSRARKARFTSSYRTPGPPRWGAGAPGCARTARTRRFPSQSESSRLMAGWVMHRYSAARVTLRNCMKARNASTWRIVSGDCGMAGIIARLNLAQSRPHPGRNRPQLPGPGQASRPFTSTRTIPSAGWRGVLVGGPVPHLVRVEQHQVGEAALGHPAPVHEPEHRGRQRGHLAHRLLQGEQAPVPGRLPSTRAKAPHSRGWGCWSWGRPSEPTMHRSKARNRSTSASSMWK